MNRFSDLKDPDAVLVPKRSRMVAIGSVLTICVLTAAHIWFSGKIGWPEAYGFNCTGRHCIFENMMHSPKLLQGGSFSELGMFAAIWCIPAAVIATLGYLFLNKLLQHAMKPKS